MVDAVDRGDLAAALSIYRRLVPLVEVIMTRAPGAMMAKAAMQLLGVIPTRTMRLPLVAPGVCAFTITPIAAHTLSFRPIVVPDSASVEISMLTANEDPDHPGCGTTLVLDGQVQVRLAAGDAVRITRNGRSVRFVQNVRSGFWATVIEKLHWAARPRMRG